MSKLHVKNDFEYKCERFYCGSWHVVWRFRPSSEEIFIDYQCEREKTIIKDVEKLISSPTEANDYYYSKLKRLSDVTAAKIELKRAEEHYLKVNSPDFDLRGNNPNREVRARKNAEQQLTYATNRLETAIRYTEILNK